MPNDTDHHVILDLSDPIARKAACVYGHDLLATFQPASMRLGVSVLGKVLRATASAEFGNLATGKEVKP